MSILERRKIKASKMMLTAPIAALAATGLLPSHSNAAVINSSDLLVFEAAPPIAANGGADVLNILEINTTSGTLVQTFNITSGLNSTTALFTNNNGSNGELDLSNNGTIVTFGGYVGNVGSNHGGDEASAPVRDAGALNLAGLFSEPATYTDPGLANNTANSTSEQVRSVYTATGSTYLFGSKNGIFTGGSNAPANTANLRALDAYNGVIYGLEQGNANTAAFYTVSATGTTVAAVSTVTNTFSNGSDFTFLTHNSTSATLYVANGTQIVKYQETSGTFTFDGVDTLPANTSAAGITAVNGANNSTNIFFTFTAANGAQSVDKVVDTSGFGANIGNAAAAAVWNAPTNAILFGITTDPAHAIISLTANSAGNPVNYGSQLGTLSITGNHGSYTPAELSFNSTQTGYVEAHTFNPTTDEEIYALDVKVNGNQANSAQLTTLITDITSGDSGVASGDTAVPDSAVTTVTQTDPSPNPFPSNFNLFLDFTGSQIPLGSGNNLLGFDLSQDSNLSGYSISAVAVVPEPTTGIALLMMGGIGFLGRRRRRPAQ